MVADRQFLTVKQKLAAFYIPVSRVVLFNNFPGYINITVAKVSVFSDYSESKAVNIRRKCNLGCGTNLSTLKLCARVLKETIISAVINKSR